MDKRGYENEESINSVTIFECHRGVGADIYSEEQLNMVLYRFNHAFHTKCLN